MIHSLIVKSAIEERNVPLTSAGVLVLGRGIVVTGRSRWSWMDFQMSHQRADQIELLP